MFKPSYFLAVLVSLLFIFPAFVSAQNVLIDGVCVPGVGDPDCGPSNSTGLVPDCPSVGGCGFNELLQLGKNIMRFVFYIAIPIATILFAYAGFLYLTAVGNSGRIEKAHSIFWSVFWGIIFITGAFLFVTVILETLGADNSSFEFLNQVRP